MNLAIDEHHRYLLDGRPIPSVTQIIGEWLDIGEYMVNIFSGAKIARSAMQAGADRGRAIHKAVNILAAGSRLDWSALDPVVARAAREFLLWQEAHKVTVLHRETPLYSTRYWYAGTPDMIAEIAGKLSIVDIKTGQSEMVGPQTAAYEELFRERHKIRRLLDRYVLLLLPNEGYKFRRLSGREADWNFFAARLYQYNFLGGHYGQR